MSVSKEQEQQTRARELHDKLEASRREVADLTETTKSDRAKISELEAKQRPRIITEEQRKNFTAFLAGAPKGPIGIICQSHDNETDNYIKEVRALLDDAGYSASEKNEVVTYMMGLNLNIAIDAGIALGIANLKQPPAYAPALRAAFERIGIKLAILQMTGVRNGIKEGEAVIIVTERR